MQKKASFVVAALACLMVAQLGLTLWSTFGAGGERWSLELYSPIVPSETIDWLVHAIAIASVMAIAAVLRHPCGFGTFVPLVVAGAFGVMVIPLFFSAVHTAAFSEFGIDQYHKTYTAAFGSMVRETMMTQSAMVAHVITAAIAAALGIWLGRRLTNDVPAGPSTLGVIATRALAAIRRLRRARPSGDAQGC